MILSFLHEFGHLQMLPVAIAHGLWLLRCTRGRERSWGQRLQGLLAATVAHKAVWEHVRERMFLRTPSVSMAGFTAATLTCLG